MAKINRNGPIYSHGTWGVRLDLPDNCMAQWKDPPDESYVWHEAQPHQAELELRIIKMQNKDKGLFGWLKKIIS